MTADAANVLVIAPNWLGDAVMALPAIADVRRHFTSARLVVAARTSVAALFELVPGVDEVVTLQWRGRMFARRALEQDIEALRRCSISILLPNSFATAWLARRAAISERWGYATDWRRRLLTRSVPTPPGSMHQGRYYQHLIAELGVPTGPLVPMVAVSDIVRQTAREQLMTAGWDGQQAIVAMAPGAAYGTAKRWLPRHFAQVIGSLGREHGVRTVLVGSAGDAETVRMVAGDPDAQVGRPIDLTGQTSLQVLAGVLSLSSAVVSNDSGTMHLAGAIGTPIVALFGPTRETETAPLTRAEGQRHVLLNHVWCRPCMLRECPLDHRCMKGLEPSRVMTALDAMLGRPDSAKRTRPDV